MQKDAKEISHPIVMLKEKVQRGSSVFFFFATGKVKRKSRVNTTKCKTERNQRKFIISYLHNELE